MKVFIVPLCYIALYKKLELKNLYKSDLDLNHDFKKILNKGLDIKHTRSKVKFVRI